MAKWEDAYLFQSLDLRGGGTGSGNPPVVVEPGSILSVAFFVGIAGPRGHICKTQGG